MIFTRIASLAAVGFACIEMASGAAPTITAAGTALGFNITTFATLNPGFTGCCGPMGVTATSNGNVIVYNNRDGKNYVFADVDGQTIGTAITSVANVGFPAYTNAGGLPYGASSGRFVQFNDNGTVNHILTNVTPNPSLGMATNPINGHIIATSSVGLIDIDPLANAGLGSFRVINGVGADGLSVSPDGTTTYIEASSKIFGYNIVTGALVFTSISFPSPDGTGVIISTNPSLNGKVIVNDNNGSVFLLDPVANTFVTIATGGTRGDYAANDTNNGSLFLNFSDVVARLTCGPGCFIGSVPLVFKKSFSATNVGRGGTIQLTLTIDNSGNLKIPKNNLGFTDPMPSGFSVVSVASNTCGPTLSNTATSVTLSGGAVAAGGQCSIVINLAVSTTAALGTANNTASGTASTDLATLTATASTNVVAPTISQIFNPVAIPLGQTTLLTFTINNGTPINLDGLIGFTDPIPLGLAVVGLVSNGCPGSVTTTASSVTLTSVSGNILNSGASCTIVVNVLGGLLGAFTNSASGTSALTGQNPLAALLVVVPPEAFQIKYAANLTLGDSAVNITNPGTNGASLNGPGFGGAAGNICVNVYAFSPDEQLVACCSCLVTPNGLGSLSVTNDLIVSTLTGIRPNSIVIKLVNTAPGNAFTGVACNNSSALAGSATFPLATGLTAFGTTIHNNGVAAQVTETPFLQATLSQTELDSITNRCANIIGNGSGFGICRSCRLGGLNATR